MQEGLGLSEGGSKLKRIILTLSLMLTAVFVLAACDTGGTASNNPTPSGTSTVATNSTPMTATGSTPLVATTYDCTKDAPNPAYPTIRIGLIPAIDSLPIRAACAQGLYAANQVNVVFVPFTSPVDRETAFKAGNIDAEIGDVIIAANLSKQDIGTTVNVIFETNPKRAVFSVLASPQSSAASLTDLRGKAVAISENTIIDYLTDYLFAKQGLDKGKGDFSTQAIPDIPTRLGALRAGKVDAALLPEPLASAAISDSAKLVGSDKGTDLGAESVLIFNKQFAAKNPDAVSRFLAAYYKVTADINSNFDPYRKVMVAEKLINPTLASKFEPVTFASPRVPTAAEIKAVSDWAKKKGIISNDLDYAKIVDASFLPK